MLISIECDKFRNGPITFKNGLNVVLGDGKATNSIGKSTLLMVIDFAFGGSGLLEHNKDIVSELGHHSYKFTFEFDGELFKFYRSTDQPDFAFSLEDGDLRPLTLKKYCSLLKSLYGVESSDLSFRALVGLYARIWGKENLEVRRPLHAARAQLPKVCVDNLLKTFDLYGPIRQLAEALIRKEKERSAIRDAFKNKLLPKINKRQRDLNEKKILEIESELLDIKSHLEKYAANINQLVDQRMLGLKSTRDELLAVRTRLQSRLVRAQKNISENRHIKSQSFSSLLEYFPEVNAARIAEVEEFHSGVAKLLREELKIEESQLSAQVLEIESRIKAIDGEMSSALSSVAQPQEIINRVHDLSTEWNKARGENEYYERFEAVGSELSDISSELKEKRSEVLALVQRLVNERIAELVLQVFGEDRKAPILLLSDSNYRFEVFEDTGTGTAYLSLVILDLAIFSSTSLPCVVHDSVLFKNVENDSVAKIIEIYTSIPKQSFIALDEIEKYGGVVSAKLLDMAAIQLSDSAVLYDKDWRANYD